MKVKLNSLEEVDALAVSFVKDVSKKNKHGGAFVVGLQGDLGAGKTAFTKSVARAFGIKGTITSPTFVIEKIYELPQSNLPQKETFSHLIHIDAYRLENSRELTALGWEDIVKNSENIILLEWPERVADILPEDIYMMYFNFIDENTREVEY